MEDRLDKPVHLELVREELDRLGKEVVRLPHWRWLSGMACQWDRPRSGAGGQQVMPSWARVVDLPMGPLPLTYCLVDVQSVYLGAYHDLGDRATHYLLLALVRKAWEPHRGSDYVVSTMQTSSGWGVGARFGSEGFAAIILPNCDTEVEALVEALRVAPAKEAHERQD